MYVYNMGVFHINVQNVTGIIQTYNNILQYSGRHRKLWFIHPSRQAIGERNKGKK
jgi:hypothetical protein